jgi:hypothetical protein
LRPKRFHKIDPRLTRDDKSKLTWAGMVMQAFWRVGMLSARLTALVLLALTLHHWTFIVICKQCDQLFLDVKMLQKSPNIDPCLGNIYLYKNF